MAAAAEITIPVEWLLGTLIVVLSALVGLSLKNMRCIARMEPRIGNIEKWIVNHREESAEGRRRIEQAEKDIIRLQREDEE